MLASLIVAVMLLAGCGDDITDTVVDPTAIQGAVTDEDGNTYPGVTVSLRIEGSAAVLRNRTTDVEGKYQFVVEEGSYLVAIEVPRASEVVDANPIAVSVLEESTAHADFTIRLLPVDARVVYGEEGVDSQNDIRNASGQKPENPDEPLYHANEPDELHPIVAPDGHHVTFGEWRQSGGTAQAACNGSIGTRFSLMLEGLIPNGVYTVQAVLVDFDGGPVRRGDGTLGPPGANVFTASMSGDGMLQVTLPPGPMSQTGDAPDCVLTQVDSARIWVIYQIDGQPVDGSPGDNREAWVEQMSFGL